MSTAQMLEPPARQSRREVKGGRALIVVLLVIALVATAFTRDWAIADHQKMRAQGRVVAASASSDTSLSSMPSFATALLLGGLRGPLVMILWTSSENQKQAHDLQDFDTKVEWIRLLQPEFDTVHLFQIWNKAYNISVQMASLRNKYTTILDGIDYGQKVEKERPDDINIVTAVAMLYGDKLGTSQEHVYYRARVRRESQTLIRVTFPKSRADEFKSLAAAAGWDEKAAPIQSNERSSTDDAVIEPIIARTLQEKFKGDNVEYSPETRREAQENDPAWRRVRLDAVLDENGRILPSLLVPRYPRPADLDPSKPWYDGSQLQFLKQYEPFPYGVSTLAFAYNDYKRAQLLLDLWNQHHLQVGDTVIDARPALTLKDWAHDEWERGRRFELAMQNISIPESADPTELERPDAGMNFDQVASADRPDDQAALYSYSLGVRLFQDAVKEFRGHIEKYKSFASVYFVHVDDSISGMHMLQADHDFLAAATATGAQRQQLLESSAREYYTAQQNFALTILKYYVDEAVMARVFPKDPATGLQFNRATIDRINPAEIIPLLKAVLEENERYLADPVTHQYSAARDTYHDDRQTYQTYIIRCRARLQAIEDLLQPTTKP